MTTGDDVFTVAPDFLKPLAAMVPEFGMRCGYVPMGDPADEATPGVVMLELQPGAVLERHAHTCQRFETVVKGSLLVGDRVLRPGDMMTAAPGRFYGPHTAGPDGVLTCEVFSSFAASYRPIFEHPDGSTRAYDYVAGEVPPEDVLEFNRRNAPVSV